MRGGNRPARPLIGALVDDIDIIAVLRALMPARSLSASESRSIAERQATRLLAHWFVTEPPVPQFVISALPGVFVERKRGWPTSGMAVHARSHWQIVLRAEEPHSRQRVSLAHEAKHVIDDPFIRHRRRYVSPNGQDKRAEQICDHFAACLLMPRSWIKRDWHPSMTVDDMAWRYYVSAPAMSRRLRDLGLLIASEPDPLVVRTSRRGKAKK